MQYLDKEIIAIGIHKFPACEVPAYTSRRGISDHTLYISRYICVGKKESDKVVTMRKPLVLFDTETGETISLPSHWMIKWMDERIDTDKARIRVNAKGKQFDQDNVGIWEETESDELATLDHPEFGEMQPLEGKRKFTKVYQLAEPTFSKSIYATYWIRVERSLEQDTGMIVNRNTRKAIEPITKISEWIKMLKCSQANAYRFIKECTDKQYLGVWSLKPNIYWIANPEYAWNGNMIPTTIWALFKLGKVSLARENKTGIKATPTLAKLQIECEDAS